MVATQPRREEEEEKRRKNTVFQLPLHYPRYSKKDYEIMEERQVDSLLREYGLSVKGDLDQKRKYAMGAFLWPDQLA